MKYNGYVWDMESDNFYHQSTTIWYIYFLSFDGKRELELWPFRDGFDESREKFLEWHNSFGENPMVASFNGAGFDHWMLWKYMDIPFHLGKKGSDWLNYEPFQLMDLYVLSQYLDPDRPRHSLASYGEQFGDQKIDFHDFSKYTEEMRVYGKQDVKLTLRVFNYLMGKAEVLYGDAWVHPSFKLTQKDYYLYAAQALSGIKFDKPAAEKLLKEIEEEMDELNTKVLPQLPPRGLKEGEKKFYSFPAKPFKKDGALSSTMEKWIEKHNAKVIDELTVEVYGKQYKIEANKVLDVELPMEIKDGDDLKDWFISQGWVPTMHNFKRDEKGKPIKIKLEVKLDKPKVFWAKVFNGDQLEGMPPRETNFKKLEEWERHEIAERILKASGVEIIHKPSERAYYSPSNDHIVLPERSQFKSSDMYYATALHELGHATGHESRLNRDLTGNFGSESYAKEELRAEIASMLIGQELQIGHDPSQHIAYLQSWIKVIKNDPKELFKAVKDADIIQNYVLSLDPQRAKEIDEKQQDQLLHYYEHDS